MPKKRDIVGDSPGAWPKLPEPGAPLSQNKLQEAFEEAVIDSYALFLEIGVPNAQKVAFEKVADSFRKDGVSNKEINEMTGKAAAKLKESFKKKAEETLQDSARNLVDAALETMEESEGVAVCTPEHVDHVLALARNTAKEKGLDLAMIEPYIIAHKQRLNDQLVSEDRLNRYFLSYIESILDENRKKDIVERYNKAFQEPDAVKQISQFDWLSEELRTIFKGELPQVWPILVKERVGNRLMALLESPTMRDWDLRIGEKQRKYKKIQNQRKSAQESGKIAAEDKKALESEMSALKNEIKKMNADKLEQQNLFEYDPKQIAEQLQKLDNVTGMGELEEFWLACTKKCSSKDFSKSNGEQSRTWSDFMDARKKQNKRQAA